MSMTSYNLHWAMVTFPSVFIWMTCYMRYVIATTLYKLTTYSDFFIQQILPCKCNFSGFYAKSHIQLEQAYFLDRKYLLQSDAAVRA
jgi:hypothetical protein